ncbi:MAG TPA: adenylate/guanylate cyclase domain-containing protein, partial [Mycobacterium sp.]|nr:adenylate/guanylate cyclase domain-containing protein [Mycobacterium sp.]
LSVPEAGSGELRRLTILFADVVGSTELSTRIEPETYRTVIGRYRRQVNEIVDRYEGHVFSTKGDGLLAVFGHPKAHENDVRRAVQAGLDITRAVATLSERVLARFGFDISVRVGVHRGMVYLDVAQDDVYGLGANLASRVSGLAPPGSVVVSGAIAPLVRDYFELEVRPAQPVKGVDEPVEHYQVLGEHVSRTRIPRGPLVGRDRELAHLRASWALAERGSLTSPGVRFSGEAGMGKSRLATVAVDLAEQSGNPVLALTGSPFHADAGLHPVRTLLEQRCGIKRTTEQADRLRLLEDEVRARGLEPQSTVPLLAPVLGIAAAHGYQPVRAEGTKLYQRIVDAIRGYLFACIGDGPAVVLAEDLQWFDPSTLDVIESLLRAGTGRLLVVLTGRDLSPLRGLAHLEVFHLTPLSADETDELITALAPTLSADERAEVQHRSDGVPFYIEEIVAKLHEQPTDEAGWARTPDTLYEPLLSRLRASDTAIQVVEAAATIGREFDHAILRSVVDMTDSDLDQAIHDLEAALVFEPTAVGNWRFRHELLREVAYELPPPSVRRILHSRVGDALVGSSDDPDWRVVAVHYEHAERFAEAAGAHQQAALDARRRGALDEARTYLTRAIAQIERTAPGPARDRHEVRFRLRRVFLASAVEGTTSPQAATDIERCLHLAGTDPSESELLSTLTALWAYYLPRGDIRRLLQLSESLRGRVSRGHWFRPTNAAAFGMVAWFQGAFGTARPVLEEATAAVTAKHPPDLESVWFIPNDPIASMHTHLALARFVQGDLGGAQEQLAATVQRVTDLGFPQGPFSHAYQRFFDIWMRVEIGQFDHAADIARQLNAEAQRHGFEYWTLVGGQQQATINALAALAVGRGDPTALQPHLETMTMIGRGLRDTEQRLFITFYDGVLARLLTAVGRAEEARERLGIALQVADETGVNFYRAELFRLRARAAGDDDARDTDLRSAIETARAQEAKIFELRAAIDDFELQGESSAGTLTDAISRFPVDSSWPELVRARTLLG